MKEHSQCKGVQWGRGGHRFGERMKKKEIVFGRGRHGKVQSGDQFRKTRGPTGVEGKYKKRPGRGRADSGPTESQTKKLMCVG